MRRKNSSHSSDIEDLKRQNQHLENQIKSLEKAKSSGHFVQAASMLHPTHNREEIESGQSHQQQAGETRPRSRSASPQPGQSVLLEGQAGPPRKKTKPWAKFTKNPNWRRCEYLPYFINYVFHSCIKNISKFSCKFANSTHKSKWWKNFIPW